jgi:hypothetical protein
MAPRLVTTKLAKKGRKVREEKWLFYAESKIL